MTSCGPRQLTLSWFGARLILDKRHLHAGGKQQLPAVLPQMLYGLHAKALKALFDVLAGGLDLPTENVRADHKASTQYRSSRDTVHFIEEAMIGV